MTLVDAVVLAALSPDELERVVEGVAGLDEGRVFHSTATLTGDSGVLSAFAMRSHDGRRFLGASGLYLAPGVIYKSADVMFASKPLPVEIRTDANLTLQGRHLPSAIMGSLPGRPATAVVDHPVLRDPRLLIAGAGPNLFTALKSRTGPLKAPPTAGGGFHLRLEQVIDIID